MDLTTVNKNLQKAIAKIQQQSQPCLKTLSITNQNGMSADFCNLGARLISLKVPDQKGALVNVVQGFKSAEEYAADRQSYNGAVIGRYANRIANGRFALGSEHFQLSQNDGRHHLNGGKTGFHQRLWHMEKLNAQTIMCSLVSPHLDEGFPGELSVTVTYTLNAVGHLIISYQSISDRDTVLNLTNHTLFNLNGSGSILNHHLQINAHYYTPINVERIPIGEIVRVDDTPFDFRYGKKVGRHISEIDRQLTYNNGYDHNFVLEQCKNTPAAKVRGDMSGIVMRIYTTEPGMQFYSGNYYNGKHNQNGGPDYCRSAFCLQPQKYPNSPNEENFPSTILSAGKIYQSRTVYAFIRE